MDQYSQRSEADPLLPSDRPAKKPFYRPRPLWIVPVAIIASLVRGMTLAPRVQVYTQLSCNALHQGRQYGPSANILPNNPSSLSNLIPDHAIPLHTSVYFPQFSDSQEHHRPEGSRQFQSQDCLSDPAVQAGAARLQTIIATITGFFSVCSTSWWGHYGQKHGRTKVLVASTLGLLTTDLAFAFALTTSSRLSSHSHKLLLFAPFVEGILGGQVALQTAISAYVSDCTSDGSRAYIFSRFSGVSYVGFTLGPALGAFLVRHPLPQIQSFGRQHREMPSVAAAFWAAILFSTVNLILSLLVIPESLDKVKRRAAQKAGDPVPPMRKKASLKEKLLPLAVFAPRKIVVNGRRREDWSMLWLALAVVLLYLAGGVFQIKYLYAEHVFGWNAEQLGYYISFVGAVRALHTLLLMPFLISTFKPSSPGPSSSGSEPPSSLAPARLARSITFDLCAARASLLLDIASHSLVAFHLSTSPLVFIGVTSISALASGTHPALESLAICILQRSQQGSPDIGALFGGLGMLTALGSILAPLIFGTVYSTTVLRYPEAVFGLAAALVLVALGATFLIRAETRRNLKGKAPAVAARRRIHVAERERGRSREIKHIGDRFRKPQRKSAHAPNDVGTGTSKAATCSCSTRAVQSDDVV